MKIATKLAGVAGAAALALALGLLVVPSSQAATTVTVVVFASDDPSADNGVFAMNVTVGDSITVTALGLAQYGFEGAGSCKGNPATDPDGNQYLHASGVWAFCGVGSTPVTGAPLPGQPVGTLIGRILPGGGWFPIGSSRTWSAGRTGALYLAYDDSVYSDNFGVYVAIVTDNG